jgi:hypothetical protein
MDLDLVSSVTLSIALRDDGGIENRSAVHLNLVAQPDQPPQIDVRLHGVRESITAKATLPVRGSITDDYGVLQAAFRYRVDEGEPQSLPLSDAPASRRDVPIQDRFLVAPLELKPGQKLHLSLTAEDGDTLRGPNTGNSRLFSFQIVSPEELLSQIAARELNLRRRFEHALDEARQAQRDLTQLRESARAADRDLAMLKLYVEKLLLGTHKTANEVGGVSQSYTDILLELQNNHIELPSLLSRVEQGVCIPLSDITTNAFPSLTGALEALRTRIENAGDVPAAADPAAESASILIKKMELVLSAMLNLETYNEAIELLRSIISLQKKVEQETKELRKKRIEELLK